MISVNRLIGRRIRKLRKNLCRGCGTSHLIWLLFCIVLELISSLRLALGLGHGGRRREERAADCQYDVKWEVLYDLRDILEVCIFVFLEKIAEDDTIKLVCVLTLLEELAHSF